MFGMTFFEPWIGILGFVLLTTGCGPVNSTSRFNVEFADSVQGLQEGDQVYLFGVAVGETGEP